LIRALIDTNILLDFLLQREPFFQDADLLFEAIATEQVVGHVTATTLTDIFYISRRHTRSIAAVSVTYAQDGTSTSALVNVSAERSRVIAKSPNQYFLEKKFSISVIL
jgi:predicted nucleic acid-binding protein